MLLLLAPVYLIFGRPRQNNAIVAIRMVPVLVHTIHVHKYYTIDIQVHIILVNIIHVHTSRQNAYHTCHMCINILSYDKLSIIQLSAKLFYRNLLGLLGGDRGRARLIVIMNVTARCQICTQSGPVKGDELGPTTREISRPIGDGLLERPRRVTLEGPIAQHASRPSRQPILQPLPVQRGVATLHWTDVLAGAFAPCAHTRHGTWTVQPGREGP